MGADGTTGWPAARLSLASRRAMYTDAPTMTVAPTHVHTSGSSLKARNPIRAAIGSFAKSNGNTTDASAVANARVRQM